MSTPSTRTRLALWIGGAAAVVLIAIGAAALIGDDGRVETVDVDTSATSSTTTTIDSVPTSEPPSSTTEAPVPPSFDVSGTWDFSFGELTLTLEGSTLRGTAVLDDGWTAYYEGELVGDIASGIWYPEIPGIPCEEERAGTSSWGTFEWRFDGPASFTGTEGNCLDEHQFESNGTRAAEAAPSTTVPGPDGLDVSGVWQTDVGEVTLSQAGGTVTGTYFLAPPLSGAGEIQAEFDGEVLIGTWAEAVTSEPCDEIRLGTPYWGTFEWRFDGDSFSGTRGFCDGVGDEVWAGTRSPTG